MTQSYPKVDLNVINAGGRVEDGEQKVLFVGQMIKNNTVDPAKNPPGTFTPQVTGSLVTRIPNDDALNSGLYGPRSMLAAMLRAGRLENPITRFDAFVFPDSAITTIATGNIVFTGTSTEDGILELIIGSEFNHKFIFELPKGTVAGDLELLIENAVTKDLTVPVTATPVAPGDIQFEAANRGVEADHITLKVVRNLPGMTSVITPMTGGANNPSLVDIFAALARQHYQTIIWPETFDQDIATPADSYKLLIEDLENKFNVDNEILDGIGIITFTLGFGAQKTQGADLDTKTVSLWANALTAGSNNKGSAVIELNYVISSMIGAIRSLRFTPGANLSRLVNATDGDLDSFGGPALASLPYFNTPFDRLAVISEGVGFSNEDLDELEAVGISLLSNNDPDTKVVALQALTLYKTNPDGNPDKSFFFLNAVDTMVTIREYIFLSLKARFSSARLTLGDLVQGRKGANVASIRAFLGKLYQDLAGPNFVLTVAGQDALTFFKENLIVTVDDEAGTATIFAKVPIVVQLRKFQGDLQISFAING